MVISSVGRLAVLSNPDSRSTMSNFSQEKCFYFKTIPSGLSYMCRYFLIVCKVRCLSVIKTLFYSMKYKQRTRVVRTTAMRLEIDVFLLGCFKVTNSNKQGLLQQIKLPSLY